jgi:hypothetical protein
MPNSVSQNQKHTGESLPGQERRHDHDIKCVLITGSGRNPEGLTLVSDPLSEPRHTKIIPRNATVKNFFLRKVTFQLSVGQTSFLVVRLHSATNLAAAPNYVTNVSANRGISR